MKGSKVIDIFPQSGH